MRPRREQRLRHAVAAQQPAKLIRQIAVFRQVSYLRDQAGRKILPGLFARAADRKNPGSQLLTLDFCYFTVAERLGEGRKTLEEVGPLHGCKQVMCDERRF